MSHSIFQCLKSAHDGDQNAMARFIELFRPLINKYAAQLKYECAETDLIIGLILLIQKISSDKFSGECDGQIVNYVTSSMINLRNNLYHGSVMHIIEEDIEEEALEALAAPDLADQDEWLLLLTGLPMQQQEIITDEFLYDLSDVEVAKSMGLSRQYVHRMKNQALQSLKAMLEETLEHKTKIN